MDTSLGELWEMVKDKEVWRAAVHGVTKTEPLNNSRMLNIRVMWSSGSTAVYTSKRNEILCPRKNL